MGSHILRWSFASPRSLAVRLRAAWAAQTHRFSPLGTIGHARVAQSPSWSAMASFQPFAILKASGVRRRCPGPSTDLAIRSRRSVPCVQGAESAGRRRGLRTLGCLHRPQPEGPETVGFARCDRAMLGSVATRSPEQRKTDALAKLTAIETNVWVASASPTGGAHLVPVTHTWNGSHVVLATGPKSRTVANVRANPRVRLALGETRDVVMVDAALVEAVPATEASAVLAEAYAAQAGWDPRTDTGDYVYLVMGPERIQVWREGEDLAGRTVMRNGTWVI